MRPKIDRKSIMTFGEMFFLFLVFRSAGVLKYLVFIVYIVCKIAIHHTKIKEKLWLPIIPALFCAVYGTNIAIINNSFGMETVKENIFVVLPVVGACTFINCEKIDNCKKNINCMFWAIMSLFLLFEMPHFTTIDLAESQYAFIFGVFTLYYFYNKQKGYTFIAAIGMILAGKRIVWGAVMLGILAILVLSKPKSKKATLYKTAKRMVELIGIACVGALLIYVYMCKTDIIEEIMYSFGINSMGRLTVWDVFSEYYDFSPLFMGLGLGAVKDKLIAYNSAFFARLHNDILVYYIELGFGGFIVFFYSYFGVIIGLIKKSIVTYKKAVIVITLIIYTFVCYCTDNISIYISYLFALYLILGGCIYEINEEKEQ